MVPIPVYDIIEITTAASFSYKQTGISIPIDGTDGLVERAYRIMKDNYPIGPVAIHLRKQIPVGAGLGGGSSDAAFTIKGLNTWFELGLSDRIMEQLAAELGSDCAFFIKNQPSFAEGRGERLSPANIDFSSFYLAVYNPGIHVSTAMAYSGVVPNTAHTLTRETLNTNLWQAQYINDFEPGVGGEHPQITAGIQQLKNMGAFYAAMSGSGSSYVGLFKNKPDALSKEGLIYFGKSAG
jgi:4-diphosphocytidyl-2-C-methyl-D-erythritol kinase